MHGLIRIVYFSLDEFKARFASRCGAVHPGESNKKAYLDGLSIHRIQENASEDGALWVKKLFLTLPICNTPEKDG